MPAMPSVLSGSTSCTLSSQRSDAYVSLKHTSSSTVWTLTWYTVTLAGVVRLRSYLQIRHTEKGAA